jgi:hypothetical protein
MTLSEALAGKSIASISFENGYYTIMFGDSSGIHIFNYAGTYEPDLAIGHKISMVIEGDEEIEIVLEDAPPLVISRKEHDYVGQRRSTILI